MCVREREGGGGCARGGLHFVIVVFIEFFIYRCYTEVLLRERLVFNASRPQGRAGGGGGGGAEKTNHAVV